MCMLYDVPHIHRELGVGFSLVWETPMSILSLICITVGRVKNYMPNVVSFCLIFVERHTDCWYVG